MSDPGSSSVSPPPPHRRQPSGWPLAMPPRLSGLLFAGLLVLVALHQRKSQPRAGDPMTLLTAGLAASSLMPLSESYVDLLGSRPHWLFELTLEVLSAPLVYLAGRAWRNGVLRHLHHDLRALRDDSSQQAPARRKTPAAPLAAARDLPCATRSRPNGRQQAQAKPAVRLPVSAFNVPFGLAGLAGPWAYAANRHLAPVVVGSPWVSCPPPCGS